MAKHQGRSREAVFCSLLPDQHPYQTLGKPMFAALRDGLAHGFRPKTVKIGSTFVRFSISWGGGCHLGLIDGEPAWLVLNVQELENRLKTRIDQYQDDLRHNPSARAKFQANSQKQIILEVRSKVAPHVAQAWEDALRIGRSRMRPT